MATETAGKDPLQFLTQKVGPLPLWAWSGAAVAIWWYLQRKQTAAKTAAAAPNQQTDPAGNVGTIDPATGYVTGTPEDSAALAAQDNTSAAGAGSAGQNATTGAQKYADNDTWGIAAVNYLVGTGINGTTASQAVQAYLNSQVLTSAQQGLVNLAIQWLGAPPTLPAPATAATTTGAATTTTTTPPDTSGSTSGTGTSGSGSTAGTGVSAAGQSTISGGHEITVGTTTATIGWTGHGRANGWDLVITGPGPINGHRGSTRVPEGVYSGLQSGHNYRVTITPTYNGTADGPAGYVDIKTN